MEWNQGTFEDVLLPPNGVESLQRGLLNMTNIPTR